MDILERVQQRATIKMVKGVSLLRGMSEKPGVVCPEEVKAQGESCQCI